MAEREEEKKGSARHRQINSVCETAIAHLQCAKCHPQGVNGTRFVYTAQAT